MPAGSGPDWSEDPRLQWHPSAAPLHQLHQEGKVSVFPSIGYAGADQSHFTSRHYWEVGETNPRANTGWLGRFLDVAGAPDNPLQGLSLDGYLAPSLATGVNPVAATWETNYDLWAPGVWGDVEELMFGAFGRIGAGAARSKDAQMREAGRRDHAGDDAALTAFGLLGRGHEPGARIRTTGTSRTSLSGPRRDARGRPADQGRLDRRARRLRHP